MHRLRMGRGVVALAAAMAAGLALGVACGGDDAGPGGDPGTTVVATDRLTFEPAELTVMAGQPVRVVLDNSSGSALHDFTVEEIPVKDIHAVGLAHGVGGDDHSGNHMHMDEANSLHVAADAGVTGTLEFTPMEPGEYEYYCTVPGHRDAGMKGTLIVR